MASTRNITADNDLLDEIIGRQQAGTARKSSQEQVAAVANINIDYPEGYKKFSEVFGFTPKSGIDHAVKVWESEDWPDALRGYIPDVDTGYVWPEEETEEFVVGLMQGDRSTILTGPKGSGKSSLGEQVCALLKWPFFRVNCRLDMESSDIFGTASLEDGKNGSIMTWVDGPAPLAAKHGCVLQMDEISATPPGISLSMQWMTEQHGKLYLANKPDDDKFIVPNEWFRVVGTDNTQLQGDTTGNYSGTQVQNEALIDRFGTAIKLDYLDRKHEKQILTNKCPDLTNKNVTDMLEFARLVRHAYDSGDIQFTMSPRGLLNWGSKTEYWKDPVRGLRISFFDKLIDDDRKVCNEFVMKIFGKEIK